MLPYLTYFAKFSYNVDQLLPIAFISNKLYSQLHFLFRKVEKGNQQSSKAGFPAIFWGGLEVII